MEKILDCNKLARFLSVQHRVETGHDGPLYIEPYHAQVCVSTRGFAEACLKDEPMSVPGKKL